MHQLQAPAVAATFGLAWFGATAQAADLQVSAAARANGAQPVTVRGSGPARIVSMMAGLPSIGAVPRRRGRRD